MAASSRVGDGLEELVVSTLDEIRSVGSGYDRVYVLFSGGRDSLAALHLTVTALGGSSVEAVFIDTGIATPGLRDYVEETARRLGVRLNIVGPMYDYFELVLRKGFPTITRRWCKEYLKIRPLREWVKTVREKGLEPLLVTGVRADESWMKKRAKKIYRHPVLKATTYSPILYWRGDQVAEYIRLMGLAENPLYKIYGKAYDCWCSVYKSPADFALLAINHPEFFARFVETEARLRSNGSGLYYNGRKIYFRDIAADPEKYLEKHPAQRKCPCNMLL